MDLTPVQTPMAAEQYSVSDFEGARRNSERLAERYLSEEHILEVKDEMNAS